MSDAYYIAAEEAADILGVSRATLYAYVSRGLIRSEPAADGSRRHRYAAADVQALRRRRDLQRNPAAAAETALKWGAPVLESGITLIDNGRLYYRGFDAAQLALQATLEEVAGLIWTGRLDAGPFVGAPLVGVKTWAPDYLAASENLRPIARFQAALPPAAAANPTAYDLRPQGIIASGASIMLLFTRLLAGVPPAAGGIAGALQRGWDLQPPAHTVLNAALVLCADHELNVSTFTARCIASAAASPYAVVQGGLAALEGTKHGGHTERVEALFREVGNPSMARDVIGARLRRGETLPGFDHPLYPQGDPRAAVLLQLVEENYAQSEAWEMASAVNAAAAELLGYRPTIDFGLVSMTRALELPLGSALALFALGRTAGWIGHALEQVATGTLIRPRARYIGDWPDSARQSI